MTNDSTCHAQLSFAAFEQDICLAYTRKNLLRGGPVELACNMIDFYEGAAGLTADPGLDLLRKSILSLSVTFFGSQHRQDHIMVKGYRQYGKVLLQLNSHLSQPEQQRSDETLLAALSCMLLEIFLPTGPSNFLKHQRGIEALMELRGPPTESTGTTAMIFRGLRTLSIIGALADSRPSLCARKEWKQAPPAQTDEVGMLLHRMFDVMADCTLLVSRRNALRSSAAGSEELGLLLSDVNSVLADLEKIHPDLQDFNQRKLNESKDLSKMAKVLKVANHMSATAYMLYNTVYICIIQIRESISPSPDTVALRNAAAIKIAQCLELKEYEKREGAPQSNTISFVATKVAWQALGRFSSPEGRRLARAVKSAVNGVFRQPYDYQQAQQPPISSTPQKTFFAQYVAMIPISCPSNSLNTAQMLQLWEHELDVIDVGYKQTSAPDPEFSLRSKK